MKLLTLSALLAALLLTACGEKEAEAPAAPAPAPAAEVAPTPAPAAPEPGGYVPTAEEQVKGITMTQEELDKMYAESRANTPLPIIPGEEPAPAAAPAAEAAPAPAAPAPEAKADPEAKK